MLCHNLCDSECWFLETVSDQASPKILNDLDQTVLVFEKHQYWQALQQKSHIHTCTGKCNDSLRAPRVVRELCSPQTNVTNTNHLHPGYTYTSLQIVSKAL